METLSIRFDVSQPPPPEQPPSTDRRAAAQVLGHLQLHIGGRSLTAHLGEVPLVRTLAALRRALRRLERREANEVEVRLPSTSHVLRLGLSGPELELSLHGDLGRIVVERARVDAEAFQAALRHAADALCVVAPEACAERDALARLSGWWRTILQRESPGESATCPPVPCPARFAPSPRGAVRFGLVPAGRGLQLVARIGAPPALHPGAGDVLGVCRDLLEAVGAAIEVRTERTTALDARRWHILRIAPVSIATPTRVTLRLVDAFGADHSVRVEVDAAEVVRSVNRCLVHLRSAASPIQSQTNAVLARGHALLRWLGRVERSSTRVHALPSPATLEEERGASPEAPRHAPVAGALNVGGLFMLRFTETWSATSFGGRSLRLAPGGGLIRVDGDATQMLSACDGARLWRRRGPSRPGGTPARPGLLVRRAGVELVCPSTGQSLWKLAARMRGALLAADVADGRVVVGDEAGAVVLVSAADGHAQWRRQLGRPATGLLADAERVFVLTEDGLLSVLGTTRGDVQALAFVGPGVDEIRATSHGLLACGTAGVSLLAPRRRIAPWSRALSANERPLCLGAARLFLVRDTGDGAELESVDLASGEVQWQLRWPSGCGELALHALAGGDLVATDVRGALLCFRASTGQPVWSHPSTGAAQLNPAPLTELAGLIVTGGHTLRALDPSTGRQVYAFERVEPIFDLQASSPGALFVLAQDVVRRLDLVGHLSLLGRAEDRVAQRTQTPRKSRFPKATARSASKIFRAALSTS